MGRRRRRRRVDPADAARALPEAIAALSQTLPAGPSPETFRRAKFDRPEAAPAFWRLLFCVLSPQLPDGASASFSPEAQVRSVKLALRTQGYPRRALAQLPDDGSQGGRELLLALAWLLAREPLPERLLAQNRVQLGDEMHVCECEALASPGPPAPSVEADGCVDIRHLQWLMGKLRFRWRNLMASQQEQCALLGKLLRRLQRENARLQAALEWRRRELVFWQWMMSVCPVTTLPSSWGGPDFSGALAFRKPGLCASLASRPTGDTVLDACPPEASQPTFLPRIPTPAAGALEPLVRELQALQGELREAVEARRAAWEAGVGGRGPEWSAARTALREAVGQDLAALRRACERGGSLAQPHGPRRLVRTEAGAPRGPGLRAPEVIEALRSREARLEVVLRRLQGQCRQELARLVGALPGLVWILPPGR
ncbi:tubulin epsilon and delta complex protein 1 isoform X2 [Balaenoptera musculus]|uniref:Tubulin epsilon and delta complex protein 1 isoform X2 n=1 Tax=Balaenoptera musculus TaxID=9771 RepID=A0A8B8WRV3_BALMU|nr:tubulin epsilon and delta complex protein 1 isoform X2 [Balaenoptera musculus]